MPIQQSSLLTPPGRPTGTILMYAAPTSPLGWLICDGTAISRSVYSGLYSVVGTQFGAGDGSTTFNLPDLRGRIPVGWAPLGGHSDVSTVGNNDGVAAASRTPKHSHTNNVTYTNNLTLANHTHTVSLDSHSHSYSSSAGGNVGTANNAGSGIEMQSGGAGSTASANAPISVGSVSGALGSLTGSITSTGAIGPNTSENTDAPPYVVLNFIIKL